MKLIPLALAALGVTILLAPGAARAGSRDTALTLTPWSGTVLRFTDRDARFSGAFSTNLGHGLWGQAEMSVPLNPVDDQAVLVDANGAVSGFTARASVGWDSTFRQIALVEGEDLLARMAFCQKHGLPDCTDSAIAAQVKKLEEELSNYHNIRPSVRVGRHYSVALEAAGSYGGVSALTDPTLRDRTLFHDYFVEIGPTATVYWKQMILHLRPGVGLGHDVEVDEVQVCTPEANDEGGTVDVCFDDLLVSSNPDAAFSAHARGALTLWDTESRLSGNLAPGIEIRTNFEQLLTGDPLLNLRLTGFLGPKAWPLGLRSGLGIDVDLGLAPEARLLQQVTPFAFIGASFGGQATSRLQPGAP